MSYWNRVDPFANHPDLPVLVTDEDGGMITVASISFEY